MKYTYGSLFLISCFGVAAWLCAENFVVTKKPQRISDEDCAEMLGIQIKNSGQLLQSLGKVVELGSTHIEQFANGDKKGFIPQLNPAQKQQYHAKLDALIDLCESYKDALDDLLTFVHEMEKKALKSGVKKS